MIRGPDAVIMGCVKNDHAYSMRRGSLLWLALFIKKFNVYPHLGLIIFLFNQRTALRLHQLQAFILITPSCFKCETGFLLPVERKPPCVGFAAFAHKIKPWCFVCWWSFRPCGRACGCSCEPWYAAYSEKICYKLGKPHIGVRLTSLLGQFIGIDRL